MGVLPPMDVGETVIQEGVEGETFYVIMDGEVEVSIHQRFIRTMRKGGYFGERALFFTGCRTATVTVSQPGTVCWSVHKQVFLPILGHAMRRHLEYRIKLQDATVSLESLEIGCVLGRGAYGVVHLVTHQDTRTQYALKCLPKRRLWELKQVGSVQREREILAESDHPFVLRMVRTFRDNEHVFF